jgi:hypothetical protein
VTGPAWYWWLATAAIVLDGWLLVAAIGGLLLGRVLRRRPPAPTPPAPGAAHGPRPAPGPHGGLRRRIDIYTCGRTVITDHREQWRDVVECGCPPRPDFRAWEREVSQ